MAERELDATLYGATGYTGRLIAHELDAQEATFAIAGRTEEKLVALADELESDPEVVVASVDQPEDLRALAERGEVMISAAGPFEKLGPPVVEAALATGTHFVDITGEQGYLRWAADQHQRAQDAEVAVVNAMGFDVVPSDTAAALAAAPLDEVTRLDIGIAPKAQLSAGTRRTMAATTGDWWFYEDGTYRHAPAGRFLRKFTFPDPIGTSSCIFVPWGDVATAHRSTGASVVRTFFRVPEKKARTMHLTWPITSLISKLPFLPQLMAARAPEPGVGPSAEERAKARFTILAEATSPQGERVQALVTGNDPYGLTGAAAARGALALARGEVEARGVLTPTQAFGTDRLVKMLSDFDLEGRLLDQR